MTKTKKYKLHYKTYEDYKGRTKTYTRLESAISDLEAFRIGFEKCIRNNDMKFYEGSGCSEMLLASIIQHDFYIVEVITETHRLDY